MPVKAKTRKIVTGVILAAPFIICWAILWYLHVTTAVEPPSYQPEGNVGIKYCRDLGEEARKGSTFDTAQGFLVALLGLGAIIIGNVLDPRTPATGDAKPPCVHNRGVLVMNFGLLLLVVSYFAFSRADSASIAAAAFEDAQAEAARPEATEPSETGNRDRTAYISCLKIRGAWLKSRVDSNALVQAEIGRLSPLKPEPTKTN